LNEQRKTADVYPLWFQPINPERRQKDFDDGSSPNSIVQGLPETIHATESESAVKKECPRRSEIAYSASEIMLR